MNEETLGFLKLRLADVSKTDYDQSGFKIVFGFWEKNLDDANRKTLEEFIKKFLKGYYNRASVRVTPKSKIIPDHMIGEIIKTRIPELTEKDIELLRFGHRLSMSSENILGWILEEYIHNHILQYGWACCWGNCIGKVDFCSKYNDSLQIKNRSNSENSSSNKIRKGTEIKKWFRIYAGNGKTDWETLNERIGVPNLMSEEDFMIYLKTLITNNPKVLYFDENDKKNLFDK